MMTNATKAKLVAFVVITTITVAYILIDYVQLPSALGFDRFTVTMELPAANGLYPNAVVTYRGVDVGRVEELRPTDDGILVSLAIDDGTKVPADLLAEVHSMAAVGEQFVDLVPQSAGGPLLTAGDTIDRERTTVPVDTSALLENVRALIDSVPQRDLATTVDELGDAFAGSSDDMQQLLDSAMAMQAEANDNLKPTVSLINQLVPVLDTQRRSGSDISSYTRDLALFTKQLAASDTDLRALLAAGPGAADQLNGLYGDLGRTLPQVLTDLGRVGQVPKAYLPGLEHSLIVYPAVIEAGQNIVPPSRLDDPYVQGSLDFKLSINDPPVCTEGFEYADNHRDPSDTSTAPLPEDSYCKVPHNDPRVVRGARNFPCPNDPSRRSADAAGCGLIFQPHAARPNGEQHKAATSSSQPQTGMSLLLGNLTDYTQPRTVRELLGLTNAGP